MPLKTDFGNAKQFLMEGALGERLKREYDIKIDGPVAMASLIYSEEGRNALRNLWSEYKNIQNDIIYLSWLPLLPAERTVIGHLATTTPNQSLRIMSTF